MNRITFLFLIVLSVGPIAAGCENAREQQAQRQARESAMQCFMNATSLRFYRGTDLYMPPTSWLAKPDWAKVPDWLGYMYFIDNFGKRRPDTWNAILWAEWAVAADQVELADFTQIKASRYWLVEWRPRPGDIGRRDIPEGTDLFDTEQGGFLTGPFQGCRKVA